MSIHDLKAVIEKPAALEDVGVTFEPDLVGDLLYDVRKRPDALPLLQFTLRQLFERRAGRDLTRHNYEEIGGLEGALNNHADTTYNQLPTSQHRASAKKLFTGFFINVAEIQSNSSHVELAEGVTSRRVTRAELQLDDPASQRIRQETLDAFTTARLLIVRNAIRQEQKQEDTTYEICHEVLLIAWERLQKWIEEDLQDIYFLQRLRPRMQQWQRESDKKKKRMLLSASHELEQLQQYHQRNGLSSSDADFLKQSQQWQKWLKRRTTALFSATILLTLIFALALGTFGYQRFGYLFSQSATTVTSLSDSGPGSLRAVIQQAPDGTTITFSPQLGGKTIQLTQDLNLNKKVMIQGLKDSTISISSGKTGKVIIIGEGVAAAFENITFMHSYTHRISFISNHGILTLTDCQLSDNQSYGEGGGAIANYNQLIVNHTIIDHNRVSGNGGAIYNLFGIVTVNNSTITDNTAYNNGGGIYSEGGQIELLENSEVSYNQAQLLHSTISNNYGGGVDVVNGSLNMFSSTIFDNTSAYYGGGIALQGSLATINDSTIHDNYAGVKGGGVIVTKNTDNNFSGLAVLSNIVVTEKPIAQYYIGQNTAGTDKHMSELAGSQKSVGDTIEVADDDQVATAGNPPPSNSPAPEQTPNYLGVAHINEFCQNQEYSYGKIAESSAVDDAGLQDIQVSCFTLNNERVHSFLGKDVCSKWFAGKSKNATIIDRLTNYFDSSSLQCYKNLKLLGAIGKDAADFDAQCKKDPSNEGLYLNPKERSTAYDWSCQPKNHTLLPVGLSVANACDTKYKVTNAIDRLINYNSPDGWQCWVPM
jgi:parallel beta-helix repeat protein